MSGLDSKRSKMIRWPRLSPMFWARTLACVLALGEGYDLGCMSGVAVILTDKWKLPTWKLEVLVAIAYFAVSVGAPCGGYFSDIYGRRPAMVVSYVLLLIGAIVMALAPSFATLLFGRVVQTLGVGWGLSVVTTYLNEVAPATQRGGFPSLIEVSIVCGVTLGYIGDDALLGKREDWRWIFGLGAILPALCLGTISCGVLPESPRFLVMQNELQAAKEVLSRLVDEEECEQTLAIWKTEKSEPAASWGEVLFPALERQRRALFLGVGVMVCQALSGIVVVAAFLSYLFSLELSPKTAFHIVVGLGITRSLAACCAMYLIDTLGRRSLLLCSTFGIACSYGLIALSYVSGAAVLPWKVLGFVVYCLCYSIGLGPVPFVFVGEIFDTKLRGKSVSTCISISRLYSGTLLFLFPTLVERVHASHIFAVCMLLNFCSFAFLYKFVPETKGIKLEDIGKMLESEVDKAGEVGGVEKDKKEG